MSAQGRQVHTTHFVSSVHFVKLAILYVNIADTKQMTSCPTNTTKRLNIELSLCSIFWRLTYDLTTAIRKIA